MRLKRRNTQGISLFVAVLVASVATLFSFAISDIAFREVILSQTGKNSQAAFYAANNGIECALYWDLKKGGFEEGYNSITCNESSGKHADMDTVFDSGGNETWVLNKDSSDLEFSLPGESEIKDPCFIIDKVNKEVTREGGNITSIDTEIIVKGYNTCDPNSSNRLERALKVNY